MPALPLALLFFPLPTLLLAVTVNECGKLLKTLLCFYRLHHRCTGTRTPTLAPPPTVAASHARSSHPLYASGPLQYPPCSKKRPTQQGPRERIALEQINCKRTGPTRTYHLGAAVPTSTGTTYVHPIAAAPHTKPNRHRLHELPFPCRSLGSGRTPQGYKYTSSPCVPVPTLLAHERCNTAARRWWCGKLCRQYPQQRAQRDRILVGGSLSVLLLRIVSGADDDFHRAEGGEGAKFVQEDVPCFCLSTRAGPSASNGTMSSICTAGAERSFEITLQEFMHKTWKSVVYMWDTIWSAFALSRAAIPQSCESPSKSYAPVCILEGNGVRAIWGDSGIHSRRCNPNCHIPDQIMILCQLTAIASVEVMRAATNEVPALTVLFLECMPITMGHGCRVVWFSWCLRSCLFAAIYVKLLAGNPSPSCSEYLTSNITQPFKLRLWEIRPEDLEALGPDLWKRSINGASSGLLAP
ncbi:hypothetical protein B0H19DRAFT_1296085 [Mycena capillaripes]|nr:hypothetical protein B0H19DRAFT_1296085 [Mycena capillaripes]